MPANTDVISHRSVAPSAASALMVWLSGSKPAGWRADAAVPPPISSTGAVPDDSSAHHGTSDMFPR
jgi:hypothetical protein